MERIDSLVRSLLVGAGILLLAGFAAVSQVEAANLTVDQIIYQTGTGQDTALMKGTLSVTVTGTNQLTFVLKNTSADGAFTDATAPSSMLLTGFGVQFGTGIDILSGTVSVGASTPVNFDGGQSLTNISNQWLYANGVIDGYSTAGVLAVDGIVSSVNNGGGTRFASAPPVTIQGPDYGAISALETQFGSSQPGVRDTVTFVLNLTGGTAATSIAAIEAGNVVLAFGSPNAVVTPEPSTYALYGIGISMLIVSSWWRKRRKQDVAG